VPAGTAVAITPGSSISARTANPEMRHVNK
jgi:hypothetical protein